MRSFAVQPAGRRQVGRVSKKRTGRADNAKDGERRGWVPRAASPLLRIRDQRPRYPFAACGRCGGAPPTGSALWRSRRAARLVRATKAYLYHNDSTDTPLLHGHVAQPRSHHIAAALERSEREAFGMRQPPARAASPGHSQPSRGARWAAYLEAPAATNRLLGRTSQASTSVF